MDAIQVDVTTFTLPRRDREAHKGDFGRVYILAGSVGYTGAPFFASRAAVRTGSGLVFLGVPAGIWPVVAIKSDEAMPYPLPVEPERVLERAGACDAVLIGPGLGRAPETEELVRYLVKQLDVPLVLDADGLNALSGRLELLKSRSAPTVLTPHEGEFARLTDCRLPIVGREEAARDFAAEYGCTVVLKGHRTVTAASDGRVWINSTGNPGMAKGGSGDVLAGMVLSLLGQGFAPEHSAAMAVWLHGRAGDLAAAKLGEYAMKPSDLLEHLPQAIRELEQTD